MRYHVLAADYDGTIATHGKVPDNVVDALKRLKASTRTLILVTGRELDDLKKVFEAHTVFDKIVAENGALIYDPATREEKKLGELPPEEFILELKKRGVAPLSVGRVIVATWEPHQAVVLECIKKLGIERQVIFNKGAVMILPSGINKAMGLEEALKEMNLSMHNVVAVGDAENDNAMLAAAECSVAVSNALEAVKKQADWVTDSDHGHGVMQLIDRLLENDRGDLDVLLKRHYLSLGKRMDDSLFEISPYNTSILLAGSSGGGKTTFTVAFVEALINKKYQFCLIDPEGDYSELTGAVVIGTDTQPPVIAEIDTLLKNPTENIVVCTLAIPLTDRPTFFNELLATIIHRRKTLGHPHWLICDEAHHLLPAQTEPSFFNIPADFNNFLMITTSVREVNQALLDHVNLVIATGQYPNIVMEEFAKTMQLTFGSVSVSPLEQSQVWIWRMQSGEPPFPVQCFEPKHVTKRHKKKYATGDMYDNSFVFKGPDGKLSLVAYNLIVFMHIGQGVDDDTWMYHLKRKDYSNWFRKAVHDEDLADSTEEVEDTSDNAAKSKKAIFNFINERYTAPAGDGPKIKGKVPT